MRRLLAALLVLAAFAQPAAAQQPRLPAAFSAKALRSWGQALTNAGNLGLPGFTTAALPACPSNKRGIAYDLTLDAVTYCNGTAWATVGAITGSGAASRCALFGGTSSLTSDTGCTYSGTGGTFVLTTNGATISGGTLSIGATGTAGIIDGLSTGTAGLLIRSNTPATGGVDTGMTLRTVGDLAAADNALLVQDNNGTNLLTVDGAGTVTSTSGLTSGTGLTVAATSNLKFSGRAQITSASATSVELKNSTAAVGAVFFMGSAAPTIGSGFGTSPSIAGTNVAGRVTVGNPSGVLTGTVTFSGTWPVNPVCTCNNEVTTLLCKANASTTTLTLTSASNFTAGDTLGFQCIGY